MGVQAAGERDGREPALWRSRLRLHVLTRCAPSVQASADAHQEPMMAETIAFVLRNLPVFLFMAAIVLAGLNRSGGTIAECLLAWILLLPIGVSGLWAAVFHLFFPDVAAADIGWEPSPFQFEVGMADLAMGATACVSFWRSLDFKAAVVMVNAIFLLSDAIGHVRQMITADNFAPGNAGVSFFADIAFAVLALILLIVVQRSEAAPRLS